MPQTLSIVDSQPIDYAALAEQARKSTPVDYAALAEQARNPKPPLSIVKSEPLDQHPWLSGAQHAVAEWWNQVNPAKAVQGMADVAAHPIEAIKAYGAANSHLADQAKESFQKGDYAEGVRHTLSYLMNGLPGVGSTLDEAGNKAQAGDIPGALGETAGLATMALAPEIAAKVPVTAALSKVAEPVARRLYTSALKPSPAAGAAAGRELAETGLSHGISVSEEGAAKLAGLIDDLNGKIKDTIQAGANRGATVDPNAVASRLDQTRSQFSKQVNPGADLAAVDAAKQEFLNGPGAGPIPADLAQDIKQGTYQQVRKSYSQLSSAQVESQKALARGIKEELATTFPELASLNATDSRLLSLQSTLDRSVARINNHDMLGLGTGLAAGAGAAAGGGPGAIAAALLKKVLDDPGMKSKLAIAISTGAKRAGNPVAFSAAMARVNALVKGLQPQTDDQRNLPQE
ncbi:MAG: hypothetical protein LAP61_22955 [Acidobacteriia bacterium]|nr:hypothetical protein [Terriglobia bacterium]